MLGSLNPAQVSTPNLVFFHRTSWLSHALSELHGEKEWDALFEWLLSEAPEWLQKYQERNKNEAFLNTEVLADLYQKELARRRAVWCWFASEIESAAMWFVYGHGGVAIGTTVGTLKSVLPGERKFQMSRIRYVLRDSASADQFNPEAASESVYTHRPGS